jgi:hypothetical protein
MLGVMIGVMIGVLPGCRGLTDTPALPAGTQDPSTFKNPAGALGMYRATVADLQYAVPAVVFTGGLLTDELQDLHAGGSATLGDHLDSWDLDVRQLPNGDGGGDFIRSLYGSLHQVRKDAAQAIGALQKYDSAAHPALEGEADALAGYAEIFLADLYCAGVPLSTVEFEGDYVYRPGSSTQAVYQHAVALFDSALTLARDSARILNLARVGRGRALLDLGQYAAAAASVASVPDAFTYQFPVLWAQRGDFPNSYLAIYSSVGNGEGLNGLPYRSSGDPRTAADSLGTNKYGHPIYFPVKYGGAPESVVPVVVASGIEARLIEAEAAYHGVSVPGGSTVTILNQLRATYYPGVFAPIPSSLSGSALLDTLFAERAAWLFLTGHRQGDLRRLVRAVSAGGYGRPETQVYPTGDYPGYGGVYGTDVTLPIPEKERLNPLFTGCFNRGA